MPEQETPHGLTVSDIDDTVRVINTVKNSIDSPAAEHVRDELEQAVEIIREYEESVSWKIPYDIPKVGDIVVDTRSPIPNNSRVRVTDVSIDERACDVSIPERNGATVYQLNLGCEPDEPVVFGKYTDGSDKEYAFPVSRLRQY